MQINPTYDDGTPLWTPLNKQYIGTILEVIAAMEIIPNALRSMLCQFPESIR